MVADHAPDHRARRDDHVPADLRPWQDDYAGPEPGPRADPHGGVYRPLPPDRQVRIGVAVVLVRDVDVGPGVDVVADVDRVVRDDVAAPADHAPVADPQHRIGSQVVAWTQARAHRDLFREHCSGTQLDPALAVDAAGWERDQRTEPEGGEPAPGVRVRG